jgi:transcriptional regulator with XRE-family HTH domain
MAKPKPPPRERNRPSPLDGLAQRLRDAREAAGMSRAQAAKRLRLGLTTLRNYEHEDTDAQPSLADLVAMADAYGVEAVELAFGNAHTATDLRRIPHAHGSGVSIPARVLDGLRGPLEAIDVIAPHCGIAIYHPEAWPNDRGGYAVLYSDRGAIVAWIWKEAGRWWLQSDPMSPRAVVRTGALLGRLALQMVRTD